MTVCKLKGCPLKIFELKVYTFVLVVCALKVCILKMFQLKCCELNHCLVISPHHCLVASPFRCVVALPGADGRLSMQGQREGNERRGRFPVIPEETPTTECRWEWRSLQDTNRRVESSPRCLEMKSQGNTFVFTTGITTVI